VVYKLFLFLYPLCFAAAKKNNALHKNRKLRNCNNNSSNYSLSPHHLRSLHQLRHNQQHLQKVRIMAVIGLILLSITLDIIGCLFLITFISSSTSSITRLGQHLRASLREGTIHILLHRPGEDLQRM
jgi:C4-dicarboxylate-specific signal transduction histidine kinase